MTALEIIIIYLACGSPFAVQHILQFSRPVGATTTYSVIVRFVFWPITAIQEIARIFSDGPKRGMIADLWFSDPELQHIQTKFENALFPDIDASAILEFRDTFTKYTGLAITSDRPTDTSGISELLSISGHEDCDVATACFQRVCHQRVLSKLVIYRTEFLKQILRESGNTRVNQDLRSVIEDLADHLGDDHLIKEIELMLETGLKPKILMTSTEFSGELWNPAQHERSLAS